MPAREIKALEWIDAGGGALRLLDQGLLPGREVWLHVHSVEAAAQAIREMVRVAKPGSLLLIADETEEHVQHAYEHIPYTAEFYKNRTATVSAPVDLLPPDIEQVHLDYVMRNRFYVLSFRKRATPTIAL